MTLIQEIERRQRRAERRDEGSFSLGSTEQIALMIVGLFVVHITLVLLVRFQYGQDVSCLLVMKDSIISIPVLTILLHNFHPLESKLSRLTAFFLAVGIGCYLVYIANEEGYYASMYRAPPLGTLWVWLFLESEWYVGLLCLLAVSAYTFIRGYHL